MGELTELGASVNILKGVIGLGVLSLPYATKQVGWLPSLLGMAVVAFMTAWGMICAVLAREKLDKLSRDGGNSETDRLCPGRPAHLGMGFFDGVVWEVLGWPGQLVCAFCIVVCQVGTAVAYVDVISRNVEALSGAAPDAWGPRAAVGLALAALSQVRTLRGIAGLSAAGLLAYLFVFGAIVVEATGEALHGNFGSSAALVERSRPNFSMWFGLTAFAFGAFPIGIAVYDDMQDKTSFMRVTARSMSLSWVFFSAFGLLGYLCYGAQTQEVVHFNLPAGSTALVGSQISISLVLAFTYVLQMYPVFGCTGALFGHANLQMGMRVLLVAVTVLTAAVIPSTAILIQVMGVLAGAICSFILPAVVYLSVQPPPKPGEQGLCVLLAVFGTLGALKAVF